MCYGQGHASLLEYGQSLVMILTSCKGMSAVKYGLVPDGIGGRSEASAVTSPEPMSPFSVVITGGDRRDGSLERVSALPH
jgi:hypothetical protein